MASSPPQNVSGDMPRFSFGDMALTDEPARVPVAADPSPGAAAGSAPVLNESVAHLRAAMQNEVYAPEILSFKEEVINEARRLVAGQVERVEEEEDATEASLVTYLQRMEIDRVNYMLRTYFRARLAKIEKWAMFLMKDADRYSHPSSRTWSGMLDRLSADEEQFLVGYSELLKDHFNKSFFSMLPDRLRVVDKDGDVDPAAGPNLDKFVFCHVSRTIGEFAISEAENDDPFNLVKGDIVVARYGGISTLLLAGDVELI